jgi:xylulokinase
MAEPIFIGLDVGTSGVKAVAVRMDGAVTATAAREYPLLTPRPGWAEQDPDEWWRGAVSVLRELTGGLGGASVQGIGLTGQMHGAVFLDASGRAIRPAILWCDQRTEAEVAEITSAVGADRLLQVTANPVLTGFQAPKIAWLRSHEPENFARVRHILLPKDFIRCRLSGAFRSDVSDCSGTSLFDVPGRRWSGEILERLGFPREWFPEAVESARPAGAVSDAGAEATGLAPGTPIAAGGGDQAAGAVGAGIVRSGVVSSTVGTSGVVFAYADRPWTDPLGRIHTFCHAVPDAWHVMGVVLSAGGALRWLRDTLGYANYAEMTAEAATAPPGADGLIFLPYLAGERTPHKDPHARAVFFGLTLSHTRAHMARAVLEGVGFALNDSFEIFRELNVPMDEVRAAGGGARSDLWLQIQADITGLPHRRMNVDEGPAYGAAILAGVATGVFESVRAATDAFLRPVSEVAPNAANRARYDDAYGLYRDLYRRCAGAFPSSAALVG